MVSTVWHLQSLCKCDFIGKFSANGTKIEIRKLKSFAPRYNFQISGPDRLPKTFKKKPAVHNSFGIVIINILFATVLQSAQIGFDFLSMYFSFLSSLRNVSFDVILCNAQLVKKLEVSDRTVENLQQEVAMLQRSDTLERARQQHDAVLASSNERHEQRLLEVSTMLDEVRRVADSKVLCKKLSLVNVKLSIQLYLGIQQLRSTIFTLENVLCQK